MKKILVFLLTLVFLSSLFFNVVPSDAAKPSPVKVTTITGEIVKLNPGVPYNKEMPAIKTAKATYILSGSIKNINKYIGYSVEMKGNIVAGPQGIQFFNVKSYKIIKKPTATTSKPTNAIIKAPTKAPVPTAIKTATPSYTPEPNPSGLRNEILVGRLSILDPVKSRFILKTEKGVAYELMGEIKGLEKLEGKKLEVTGNYVYTLVATEYPLFSVISYKVIEETGEVIITEKDDGGYVYVKKGDVVKLSLESNKTTGYSWNIDKSFDKTVLLQTGYEYIIDQKDEEMVGVGGREVWTFNAVGAGTTVTYLSYSRPWESVSPAKSFKVKVIVEDLPTPTPSYEVLKGTLIVNKVEQPVISDSAMPQYEFLLKTENGPCTLIGNVKGLEKYDGAEIEVTGKFGLTEEYPPRFNVLSYVIISTPTPTPSYDVLRGTLSVTAIKTVETERIVAAGYSFSLKTEKGPFTLQGNVKGLEKYNGEEIEVTGTISPLEIYPPIFNVVSYVVLPVSPTPTPTLPGKTHTIISDKALYVSDPTLGIITANAQGNVTISWTDDTKNAFFKAKVFIPEINVNSNYEFELVQATACDSSSIQGTFNISRNGKLVAEKVTGKLYGLDLQVGSYFKFYSEGEKWHLSAYITSRMDF